METKVIPVKVALRCRPLVTKEEDEGCKTSIRFVSKDQIVVGSDKAFTFDFVYQPTSSQESIYSEVVQPLIKNVFKGYNATVLAYGQTGSGKTYSMGTVYDSNTLSDNSKLGIIPRTVKDIFAEISNKSEFSVGVTFIEIYNEDVVDLLVPKNKMKEEIAIREDYNGEIKLTNLQEIKVSNLEETLKCLELGSLSRTTGATAMNLTSSRSHAIFTLHIKQNGQLCVRSKFHLVDLAGSERAKKTRAQGERFKEGVNINRGLLALGNVISALCEDKSRSHVPYRDSKLTRLLQDSLGGNSHTAMIACVSPADSNLEETVNTLRYADRARKIKNKPIINQNPQDAEVARLKQLIQQLQMQIIPSAENACVQDFETCMAKCKQLQNENWILTKDLQNLLNQNTILNEKLLLTEEARDKMKKKLIEISQKTGYTMDCLSVSMNTSNNPQLKDQFEVIKFLHEKVADIQDEQEKINVEMNIADKSVLDIEEDEINEEESPRDEFSKTHTIKQAEMNRELQDLNRVLALKVDLMNKMERNDDEFTSMRQQYENNVKQLEEQIAELMKERDRALNNPSNKISEQRRKRLQELETEIAQLRKKLGEQSKLIKIKEQSDHKIKTLHQEILAMKQTRVKLIRQMREDSDKFRQWKQAKDRELAKLKQQERRRQFEIVRMEQTHNKQQGVLRRKMEEVVLANKRLKDALALRKTVSEKRNENKDQHKQIAWLKQEFELVVSSKQANHYLQFLLENRKTIAEELSTLKKQLEDAEPPTKRIAWESNNGVDSDSSGSEVDTIKDRIAALEQDQELRSVQIADFQQKIIDADQDDKGNSRWENVHSMVDAKCALKWIFDMAVSVKVEFALKENEYSELKSNYDEMVKLVEETKQEMNQEIRKLKQHYEEEKTRLEAQSATNAFFLMRQLPKIGNEDANNLTDAEQSMRERLRVQEDEIANFSEILDEFERKKTECEDLRRELVMMHCTGEKGPLMPQLRDFSGSPITINLKNGNKTVNKSRSTRFSKLADIISEDEDENENEDIEDDSDDPDWRMTPVKSRVADSSRRERRKRKSSEVRCKCKGNCSTRICSCKRNDRDCNILCTCTTTCLNRDTENSENCPEGSNLNTTFNINSSETKLPLRSSDQNNSEKEESGSEDYKYRRRTLLHNVRENYFLDSD